jgi:DNA polymerase-3 subunit delta
MLTKFSDFESSLQKKRFQPNYFLFGSDSFLLEEARCALARAVEEATGGALASESLDLDEVSLDVLLNRAQSLSMFAPRQMIWVKSVMKLRESQGRKLEAYFANPNPQTIIVFLAGDLDRDQQRKKIYEILTSGTRVVELAPFGEREIIAWIERRLESHGFSIDPAAADFLRELQGNDLGRLHQELEKAMLFAGSEKRITLPMIEAVSGFAAGHTLFEFLDAVSGKNKVKSLELIEEIFFRGKETGLAFWWFGQQLRQWLQFNEMAGKVPAGVLGKQIGVYNPHVAARMMGQAKQFSRSSLLRAIRRLAEVDDKVKRSSPDTRFTMELLVHELTG